jgi:tRNA(Ile)-lysidine synthase
MRAPTLVASAVERTLARLLPAWPDARLCIALSGGVDSVTLLHVCHGIRAMQPSVRLRALHLNHGLQPAATDWAAHCRTLCDRLDVPFESVELRLSPPPGASVEAAARDERYRQLRSRLGTGEALLTAHHQDDQLETVLLQLFRGAGIAGLAAMPASAPFGSGMLLRPLLEVTRADIDAYARNAGLAPIEDPTNLSRRFDRGLLRREITPLLRARWPAVSRAVARSARHAATAQRLLDDLARIDAADALRDLRLAVARLQGLPRARQANLLRWWLRQNGLGLPSEARLGAILDDLLPARADAQPVVSWPTGEVRRHRGWLYAMQPLPQVAHGTWPLEPGRPLTVAGAGTVILEAATGTGISAKRFPGAFELRLRQGGERLRAAGQAAEKSVTRLLREADTPPWLRERVPLVYAQGSLLAVGDLWVSAAAAAEPGEPGFEVRWLRSA